MASFRRLTTLKTRMASLGPFREKGLVLPSLTVLTAEPEEIDAPPPSATLTETRRLLDSCPPDHPEREKRCICLAKTLGEQWRQSGNVTLLHEAIALGREALSLCPVGHPGRAASCDSLAVSLRRYSNIGQDKVLLHEATSLAHEAVELTPENHPDRALYCEDLAVALSMEYDHVADKALLMDSIRWAREALSLRPDESADRASSCITLGMTLVTLFTASGGSSSLQESIDLNRQALNMLPEGHFDFIQAVGNLAWALCLLFDQDGDHSVLSEAITLQRRALTLITTSYVYYAQFCTNLANTLTTQYQLTGDETAVKEAISLERTSLSLRPIGNPEHSASCTNLATSLALLYEKTGKEEYINEAISLSREAMQSFSTRQPYHATLCGNFAYVLKMRFVRTGNPVTMAEVIALEREAMDLCPVGHPDHARWAANVSITLYLSGKPELLSEAITLAIEALEGFPPGHPYMATTYINAATMMRKEFEVSQKRDVLKQAISFARIALQVTDPQNLERRRACEGLARLLIMDFECSGDASLLLQAHVLLEEARDRAPPNAFDTWEVYTQLARLRLYPQGPTFDLRGALSYLNEAVRMNADDPQSLLSELIDTVQLVYSRDEIEDVEQSLLSLHEAIIDLMSFVAALAFEERTQLQALANCGRIAADTFSLFARAGQISTGVQLLEHARGIIWSQALNLRDPQLSQVPPEYSTDLSILLRSIAKSKAVRTLLDSPEVDGSLTARDVRYEQINRTQQIIRQLRLVPGLENFMRGASADELIRAAESHPVVVLVSSSDCCRALIMRASEQPFESFVLEDMRLDELMELTLACRSTDLRGSANQSERGLHISRHDRDRTAPVLAKLWRAVVKPVVMRLGLKKKEGTGRPRIHWCPTGEFTFLPLHAAGVYQGAFPDYLSEYAVSSYTPTISALLRARAAPIYLKPSSTQLLLVAEKHTKEENMPILFSVDAECDIVAHAASKSSVPFVKQLSGNNSVSGVVEDVSSANIVHMACHGVQNASDALSSGFCLRDGNLTVSQLMKIELSQAFLAFLSACETARGDVKQPDQTVHLAAAMLFAGFRSVIATMWAMNDTDGPFVAQIVYERLFSQDKLNADSVPYVLDAAAAELRRKGAPPERWATFIHMGA